MLTTLAWMYQATIPHTTYAQELSQTDMVERVG